MVEGIWPGPVNRIIVAMSSTEMMADQKAFSVAVSRARDDITLITDDAERQAARLEAQTGEKITALEAYVATITERENCAAETSRETDKTRDDDPKISAVGIASSTKSEETLNDE